MKLTYVEVGQIVNTHGVRGELKYSLGATIRSSFSILKHYILMVSLSNL